LRKLALVYHQSLDAMNLPSKIVNLWFAADEAEAKKTNMDIKTAEFYAQKSRFS